MSRVRADSITNKTGSGPTDFPLGFTANTGTVTGLLTASTYDIADLNVSAAATVASTTESTSSTTGALIVSGGVGIAKSLHVGGNISCAGTITYDDVKHVDALGVSTFREGLIVNGGRGVNIILGGLNVSGVVTCGPLNVGSGVTVSSVGLTTLSRGLHLQGGNLLYEKCFINSTAWSTNGDINLDNGMVQYNSSNLAGTTNTLNITSSVGINTQMSAGDIMTVTCMTEVNATTAYVNHITVDHAAVTEHWVGGSAPSAGGSSGVDVYTFNILKTASDSYVVTANQSKCSS